MAAPSEFILFRCLNKACGQQIKLRRPAISGIYDVTCPHCGDTKKFNLTGLDKAAPETPSRPSSHPASGASSRPSSPSPDMPDNSTREPIELTGDYRTGVKYTETCPHCHAIKLVFNTDKPGRRVVECPRCRGKVSLDIRKPTEVVSITGQVQLYRGKLILLRKGWLNKTFHLAEGVTVIGRYDEAEMSDISIKNDGSISRRSIEIKTEKAAKGYTFKLKVIKATNPVLHNGHPLLAGESVSLNFGDTLTLGKTRLRFEKDM